MRGHPLRGEPLRRPWYLVGVCTGCGRTLEAERDALTQLCVECDGKLEAAEPSPALPRPRTSLPLWGVPCPDGERRLLAWQPTGWVPR